VLVLALTANAVQELLLAAAGTKAVALGAIALGSLSALRRRFLLPLLRSAAAAAAEWLEMWRSA
jgi:hypothetical protein